LWRDIVIFTELDIAATNPDLNSIDFMSFVALAGTSFAFSALTLLVGWQEGRPVCKKLYGGVLAWLSVRSKVQICIWPR